MINKKIIVEKALSFSGPLPYIPKGELFIERSFIDKMCPFFSDGYVGKLKGLISILDLDLVGISHYEEEFFKEKHLKEMDDIFLVCNIKGPFSFWTGQLGYLETLKALRRGKEKIHDLTESFLENLRAIFPQFINSGFCGIAVVDDIAGNEGTFFSRDDFKALLEPVYTRMVEMIKSSGLYAFFHSDGNLEKYVNDFVNVGFDCLCTFDAQAGMDVYKMNSVLQKRVCFMGHINLFGWGPEKIRMEVDRAKEMFLNGGLILGSSSGLCEGILKERIFALYPQLKERLEGGKI